MLKASVCRIAVESCDIRDLCQEHRGIHELLAIGSSHRNGGSLNLERWLSNAGIMAQSRQE